MKNIKIISATKGDKSNSLLLKTKPLFESLYKTITYCFVENNQNSLAQVYNKFIIDENKDKILVFIHDDCVLDDIQTIIKLNNAMETYDVVGLAGIKAPITIKEPALWHLLGDRSQLSGAVAHFTGIDDNERFMTNFGPTPARAILLDGVFLAINVEKVLKSGIKFDETNPARFHYYDLDFCLCANNAGLKLGTWPIWITHKSHGLTNPDQEFFNGQKWFINKHTKRKI